MSPIFVNASTVNEYESLCQDTKVSHKLFMLETKESISVGPKIPLYKLESL